MGNTLVIQMPQEIKKIIKRVRPADWVVITPPAKRIKTFHDTGAKAPLIDNLTTVD